MSRRCLSCARPGRPGFVVQAFAVTFMNLESSTGPVNRRHRKGDWGPPTQHYSSSAKLISRALRKPLQTFLHPTNRGLLGSDLPMWCIIKRDGEGARND